MLNGTMSWLLDATEPAVRAQALIHFAAKSPEDKEVKSAREESLKLGSIAKILTGIPIPLASNVDLFEPRYGAPYHRLIALADMGAPPDERITKTLDTILDTFAKPDGGFHRAGRKEGHLCITGNLVRAATHFGRGSDPRVRSAVEWLVLQQRADGGWNCFPDEPESIVDSWEPLAALGTVPTSQRTPEISTAINRGLDFFLEQRLGVEAGYDPWRRIHFPRHYYYDFLLGLEIVTSLGDPHDPRLKPGLELLVSKRTDGRWQLDLTHPDVDPEGDPPYKPIYDEMMRTAVRLEVEAPKRPSRWATLAALRILQRAGVDA